MRYPILFAALLVTIAAPAAAQDGSEVAEKRTVERAQQFLVEFYNSLGDSTNLIVGAWLVEGTWQLGSKPAKYSASATVESTATSIRADEPCKLSVSATDIRRYSPWAFERGEALADMPSKISANIDWKKIRSVSVRRNQRLIRGDAVFAPKDMDGWYIDLDGSSVSLLHTNEANARRAANAMEFLREQCGFRTETGF